MPGGTGRPALVISARLAPLPPSVSFIVRSPSALPLPKKYTNFPALAADFAARFGAAFDPPRAGAVRVAALEDRAGVELFFAVFFLAMSVCSRVSVSLCDVGAAAMAARWGRSI